MNHKGEAMSEERYFLENNTSPVKKGGYWYLVTGFFLGVVLGLIYTWWINPMVYQTTDPASLSDTYKDTYRSTIAQVYVATGNLERAQRRLNLLEDENPVYVLGAQAQRALAEGNAEEARALALLASDLQSNGQLPLVTAETISPDVSASATPRVVPTQTLPLATSTP